MPRFRPRQRSLFGGIPSPEEFKELFPSLIPDDYFAYRDNSIDISTIHRLLRHLRNKADSLRDLLLKSSYTLPPTSGQTYLRPPSSTRRDEDEHSDFTDTADTQRPKSTSRRNSGNASGSRRASGRARGVSTSMLHELTFLPHPSQLQKSRELSNSTMCGVPVLELSRRVYALGDAFRNVVMKVQALNTDEAEEPFNTCGEGPGRNGVMTLMEMCVRIIGSDIETSVSERLEDACSDEEDIEKTGLVDYCYDKIPDHLKRWVVIPHVIQILFINIPRNIFTLWDMCLDSIIEHNAKADSITLLNRILRHALIPSCTLSRPLILSGPTDFLTRLMQKSNPTSPSKPVPISWSEAEFVSILIHTISQIPAKHVESVWTCDAISFLFAELTDGCAQCCLVEALSNIRPATALGWTTLRGWSESVFKRSLELTAWSRPPQSVASKWCHWLNLLGESLNEFLEDPPSELSSKKAASQSLQLRELTLFILLQSIYLGSRMVQASSSEPRDVLDKLVTYSRLDKLQQSCSQFISMLSTSREAEVGCLSMDAQTLLEYAEAMRQEGLLNLEVAYLGAVLSMEDEFVSSDDMELIRSALEEAHIKREELQRIRDAASLVSSPGDPLGMWEERRSRSLSPPARPVRHGRSSIHSFGTPVPETSATPEDELFFVTKPPSHRKRRRVLDSDDEDSLFTPKRPSIVIVCTPTPQNPGKSDRLLAREASIRSTSTDTLSRFDSLDNSRLATDDESAQLRTGHLEDEQLLDFNSNAHISSVHKLDLFKSGSPTSGSNSPLHDSSDRVSETPQPESSLPATPELPSNRALNEAMDVDMNLPSSACITPAAPQGEPVVRSSNLLNLPPLRKLSRSNSIPRISRLLQRRQSGNMP